MIRVQQCSVINYALNDTMPLIFLKSDDFLHSSSSSLSKVMSIRLLNAELERESWREARILFLVLLSVTIGCPSISGGFSGGWCCRLWRCSGRGG